MSFIVSFISPVLIAGLVFGNLVVANKIDNIEISEKSKFFMILGSVTVSTLVVILILFLVSKW